LAVAAAWSATRAGGRVLLGGVPVAVGTAVGVAVGDGLGV